MEFVLMKNVENVALTAWLVTIVIALVVIFHVARLVYLKKTKKEKVFLDIIALPVIEGLLLIGVAASWYEVYRYGCVREDYMVVLKKSVPQLEQRGMEYVKPISEDSVVYYMGMVMGANEFNKRR